MKPSKIEEPSRSRPARYSGLPDEHKFSRHLLFGLFLVFAYVGVVALLDRLVSTGAGNVFMVLPLAVMVLYLVWKGWIEKAPK